MDYSKQTQDDYETLRTLLRRHGHSDVCRMLADLARADYDTLDAAARCNPLSFAEQKADRAHAYQRWQIWTTAGNALSCVGRIKVNWRGLRSAQL